MTNQAHQQTHATLSAGGRMRLGRRAQLLAVASVAYNVMEAVIADSTQTLLCTYLSAVLLAGLILNATLGWSWADPIAGLVIAAVAVKEGRDAWRGEGCCGPTTHHVGEDTCGRSEDGCTDDCCSSNETHLIQIDRSSH